MTVHSDLFDLLIADAPLAALVGVRIRWGAGRKSDALPYVTLERISRSHEHHMTAASGLSQTFFEAECYAATPETAFAIGEAVREALDGMVKTTVGSTDVKRAALDDEADDYVPPQDGSEDGEHVVRVRFHLWHAETVPTF